MEPARGGYWWPPIVPVGTGSDESPTGGSAKTHRKKLATARVHLLAVGCLIFSCLAYEGKGASRTSFSVAPGSFSPALSLEQEPLVLPAQPRPTPAGRRQPGPRRGSRGVAFSRGVLLPLPTPPPKPLFWPPRWGGEGLFEFVNLVYECGRDDLECRITAEKRVGGGRLSPYPEGRAHPRLTQEKSRAGGGMSSGSGRGAAPYTSDPSAPQRTAIDTAMGIPQLFQKLDLHSPAHCRRWHRCPTTAAR